MPGMDEWIKENQKLFVSIVAVVILALGAVVKDFIESIVAALLLFSISYFIEWSRTVTELVTQRLGPGPTGEGKAQDEASATA